MLAVALAKNLKTLKPRCIRIKENFFRLNQALSALEALRQTKVNLVELNQWLVKRLISLQIKPKVPLPTLYLAGKRGLVKAINRFDFDYPVHFASYAQTWVKHELRKQTTPPRQIQSISPSTEAYTFGDISLWSLIELANGTTNFPPKVNPIDLQTRVKNIQEVHYGLSLLPSRERRMLMLRCCRPKRTFLSIGNEYKLSKERVRQLCNRSIKRLKSIQPPFPNVKSSDLNSVLFYIKTSKSFHHFAPQNVQTASTSPSFPLFPSIPQAKASYKVNVTSPSKVHQSTH
ncbi:MAG: sigma-70 family RNA polymerase sigma factor [Candidatus Hodgkinia cicadicola]